MVNENQVPNPVLPLPPVEYDVQYMNQLIRLLNFYMEQQRNPGTIRGSSIQLSDGDPDADVIIDPTGSSPHITKFIVLELPTSATGLVSGQIWRDTATNILHIVP